MAWNTGSNPPGEELMTRRRQLSLSAAPAISQFVEQPRVLDGDDGLGGEILYQDDLLFGEWTNLLPKNGNHADRFVILDHWYGDGRCRAPPALWPFVAGTRRGLAQVHDLDRPPSATGPKCLQPRDPAAQIPYPSRWSLSLAKGGSCALRQSQALPRAGSKRRNLLRKYVLRFPAWPRTPAQGFRATS